MTGNRGAQLLDRFAAHYGIDVSTLPIGNLSWRMNPAVGTELTGLSDDVPPFSHTGGAARGHWQTTFEFRNGEELVRVVANSKVVVTQITGRRIPATLITGAEGRDLATIVSHPVLAGLTIDQIETSEDDTLCSIVCLWREGET